MMRQVILSNSQERKAKCLKSVILCLFSRVDFITGLLFCCGLLAAKCENDIYRDKFDWTQSSKQQAMSFETGSKTDTTQLQH